MFLPTLLKRSQRIALASLALILLASCSSPAALAAAAVTAAPQATQAAAVAACKAPAALTPAVTEGPYFQSRFAGARLPAGDRHARA